MSKVYCKDCARWFRYSKADTCVIPNCGLENDAVTDYQRRVFNHTDEEAQKLFEGRNRECNYHKAVNKALYGSEDDDDYSRINLKGQSVILSKLHYVHAYDKHYIYGTPSQLNTNNDCYFFVERNDVDHKLAKIFRKIKNIFVRDVIEEHKEKKLNKC